MEAPGPRFAIFCLLALGWTAVGSSAFAGPLPVSSPAQDTLQRMEPAWAEPRGLERRNVLLMPPATLWPADVSSLYTAGTQTSVESFASTASKASEPIGLLLLGMGLVGAASAGRSSRRRRTAQRPAQRQAEYTPGPMKPVARKLLGFVFDGGNDAG